MCLGGNFVNYSFIKESLGLKSLSGSDNLLWWFLLVHQSWAPLRLHRIWIFIPKTNGWQVWHWVVKLKSRYHKAAQTLHLFYSLKTLTKVVNCYIRVKCFAVPHKGLTEEALSGPELSELLWIHLNCKYIDSLWWSPLLTHLHLLVAKQSLWLCMWLSDGGGGPLIST